MTKTHSKTKFRAILVGGHVRLRHTYGEGEKRGQTEHTEGAGRGRGLAVQPRHGFSVVERVQACSRVAPGALCESLCALFELSQVLCFPVTRGPDSRIRSRHPSVASSSSVFLFFLICLIRLFVLQTGAFVALLLFSSFPRRVFGVLHIFHVEHVEQLCPSVSLSLSPFLSCAS